MSFTKELQLATASDRQAYVASPYVQRCMKGGFTRDDYLTFLHQFYFIVREFCPTMSAAASRLPSHDPYFALKYELYHRAYDEKGHQQLVLDDIAAIGGDVEKIVHGQPSTAVQAMIGYNYSAVERDNPCAVFAMLYVLETLMSEMGPHAAKAIAQGLGLTPTNGLKFFFSHAELDQEHAAELLELLESIPTAEDRAAIVRATHVNYFLLTQIMS